MDLIQAGVELRGRLESQGVVPFVGAGLSSGAGLPGWYVLIQELAQRMGHESLPPVQWATSESLITVAQDYVNARGLNSLVAFLKERLDSTGIAPTAAHHAVAQLPISLVFTANYDDLLERAFRDAGKRIHIVTQDGDLPYLLQGRSSVNIVKLYGDLRQPDSIVLARAQYERFFRQRPQMVRLLETELARSTFLYLGWSHSDPHFGLMFGELLDRFGSSMRAGYALMFDVSDVQRMEFDRRQIHIVNFSAKEDRTAQIANWLTSLRLNS